MEGWCENEGRNKCWW